MWWLTTVVVTSAVVASGWALVEPHSPLAATEELRLQSGEITRMELRGASIEVPAGAFDSDARIIARTARLDLRIPGLNSSPGRQFEFKVQPDQDPQLPLRLTLPLRSPLPAGAETVVAFADGDGRWRAEPATVDPSGRTMSAEVSHLSLWSDVDLAGLASDLVKGLANLLGQRGGRPACSELPPGYAMSVPEGDDPPFYACLRSENDDPATFRLDIVSNRGYPQFFRPNPALALMSVSDTSEVVDGVVKALFAEDRLVYLPGHGTATLHYRPEQGPGDLGAEPSFVSLVASVAISTGLRGPVGAVAGALLEIVSCARSLLGRADVVATAERCIKGVVGAGEVAVAELKHSLEVPLRLLGRVLAGADLVRAADAIIDTINAEGRGRGNLAIIPPRPTEPEPPEVASPSTPMQPIEPEDDGMIVIGCH